MEFTNRLYDIMARLGYYDHLPINPSGSVFEMTDGLEKMLRANRETLNFILQELLILHKEIADGRQE